MSRPEGVVDAARALLAGRGDIKQVHEIVLRDIDRDDEKPRCVTLIPIGDVIGIAIHNFDERPKESEMVFVAAPAFGNTLPALGFTATAYTAPHFSLVAPRTNSDTSGGEK